MEGEWHLGWFCSKSERVKFEINTIFDFFDVIGRRPGVFLGKKTITGLYHFYNGYVTAMSFHYSEDEYFYEDFCCLIDYIKAKTNTNGAYRGWLALLLDECNQDDEAAFDKFFEYVTAFRQDNLR